jgi:hypothetical protein
MATMSDSLHMITLTIAIPARVTGHSKSSLDSLAQTYVRLVEDALRDARPRIEMAIYEVDPKIKNGSAP